MQISVLAPAKTNYMWELKWPVHVLVSSWLYLMCAVFIFQLPVFIHLVFPGHRCPTSGFGTCVHVRKMFLHTCTTIVSGLNSTVYDAWGLVMQCLLQTSQNQCFSEVWNVVKTVRFWFTLPRMFFQRDIRNAVQNSKATCTFSVSWAETKALLN